MYQKILKIVQKKDYFSKHKKVLIAVSGGVDSMNLLHFLYLYQDVLGISIGLVHVNHKQRPESDQEENYLRDWAKQHEIPIYVSYFKGKFTEQAGRNHRYTFFKKVMHDYHYTALVTAHHADDQAETVLMRLIRGSRLRHLKGIVNVQPFANGELIRPFLMISKDELPNIFHFEDVSNHSSKYLRNRIRNDYIPMIEKENPKFSANLDQLAQETNLIFQALEDLTSTIDITNCHEFIKQSLAVQTILLQHYLEKFPNLQVSKGQFDEMLSMLRTKSSFIYQIKGSYILDKKEDKFSIVQISPKTDRTFTEKMLECDKIVKIGQYSFSFRSGDGTQDGIPLYSLNPIYLRHRKPGDSIDFGSYSKKLRRLFIDEKFSQQERKDAIVGEQDGQIIFVCIADKTYLRKALKHDIMGGKLYIESI